MKFLLQSLSLTAIASVCSIMPINAVEIGGLHYCSVTVTLSNNSERYTLLIPQVNLHKLLIISIDKP